MVIVNVASGLSMKKKTTKGRKKIEIKKIEETNSRQVTFSKRRAGLFKKASELCVLTGAQIAILVNSPGGRVFTFGHPNADLLLDRYLNDKNKDTTTENPPQPLDMSQFNQHYMEVSRELEMEKKRREMIPARSGGVAWYDESVDGLEVEELEQYICSLEELKMKVVLRANDLMIKNAQAKLGSNVFEMGWNNNMQTVAVPSNVTVDGGLNFHHGGKVMNF